MCKPGMCVAIVVFMFSVNFLHAGAQNQVGDINRIQDESRCQENKPEDRCKRMV